MEKKLQEKRQQAETKHGEDDSEDKVDIPVSGLQQQLQIDHDHDGLSHGGLEGPEVCLLPGVDEVESEGGGHGVP